MNDEKVTVWLEEEYGYRYWKWETGMTEQELVSWWSSLESVGKYFWSPTHLPGKLTQLHELPIGETDEEIKLKLDKVAELLKAGNGDQAMELLNPAPWWWENFCISNRAGKWYCHVHMDDDSVLVTAKGRRIKHKGFEEHR